MQLQRGVSLAPFTTLELGGRARYLAWAESEAEVFELLRWARDRDVPVTLLAGGSNVVICDDGLDGLVLGLRTRGVRVRQEQALVEVTAAAGEDWDSLVRHTVEQGWSGLECLSGIPGSVGATPIQNVGAYGREVREVLRQLRVIDRRTLAERVFGVEQCEFSYRSSRFRREPDRFVVLEVTFGLRPGGILDLRYRELADRLPDGADPAAVREVVLELRREKSMVIDPRDPNRRSVGSFFLNPVLSEAEAARVEGEASLGPGERLPRFPAPDGVKVPAAWLIRRSGFQPGYRRGTVGLSSRHCLALVHHGQGSTSELIALAREIRDEVERRFGVRLVPEPVFLGFPSAPL